MRVFLQPIMLVAVVVAMTVTTLVQGPASAGASAPRVASISISPGGPGYSLSGHPSYTAQVPGATSATFTLSDGQDVVWSGSAATVSNVASVTPPAGLLEPGGSYSIDVVARQGDVVSAPLTTSFQVDSGAAVDVSDTCSAPCVPYSPERAIGELSFGAERAVDLSLEGLPGNAADIGTLRLRVTIDPSYDLGSTGDRLDAAVRIFDPSAPTPVGRTLSHLWRGRDKKSLTKTVDVPVSSTNAIRVLGEGVGSGSVHVTISAIGWFPWETADEAAAADAEDAAEPTPEEAEAALADQEPVDGAGGTLSQADEAALEAAHPGLQGTPSADCGSTADGPMVCNDPSAASGGGPAAATPRPATTFSAATAHCPSLANANAWRRLRFEACNENKFIFWQTLNGRRIGEAEVFVQTDVRLSRLTQQITVNRTLDLTSATGSLRAGVILLSEIACIVCKLTGPSEVTADLTSGALHAEQTFTADGNVPAGQQSFDPVTLVDTWTGKPGAPLKTQPPQIRCDNVAYVPGAAGGCVIEQYKPTLNQSLTGVTRDMRAPTPAIVRHIKRAQAKAHYGEAGNPLMRMYNPAQKRDNRRKAVSKCRALGLVPSCDEYPYASTYQGCASIPFLSCDVASVPLTENSSQGRDLGRFYAINRLIDHDRFAVAVVP